MPTISAITAVAGVVLGLVATAGLALLFVAHAADIMFGAWPWHLKNSDDFVLAGGLLLGLAGVMIGQWRTK